MQLMALPMFVAVFVGVKTFLDNHLLLVPIVCLIGFIVGFIFLVKWNLERLRGN